MQVAGVAVGFCFLESNRSAGLSLSLRSDPASTCTVLEDWSTRAPGWATTEVDTPDLGVSERGGGNQSRFSVPKIGPWWVVGDSVDLNDRRDLSIRLEFTAES